MRIPLVLLLLLSAPLCHAWNWQGQVRTKLQSDNRYTGKADIFGEVWGQLGFEDRGHNLRGAVDIMGHAGRLDYQQGYRLYQGFIDQGYAPLDSRIKVGRFERTDNLGFYLLDGGGLTWSPDGQNLTIETYAGRPSRIDHVRSVDGDFIAGLDARTHYTPNWGERQWPGVERIDLRGGYQHFEYGAGKSNQLYTGATVLGQIEGFDPALLLGDARVAHAVPVTPGSRSTPSEAADRWQLAANAKGYWRSARYSGYEIGVLGTLRSDQGRLENALATASIDFGPKARMRNSYEYYRPREPFLTFRERFYSAYVLGEQTLIKSRLHYNPTERWTGYVGGMKATRQGDDGYGGDLGLTFRFTPNLALSGEFDYLGLGADEARSGYAALSHTVSSRLQLKFNSALRYEQKQFYGNNRATGFEGELRYMVQNDLVLQVAASQIWNTRLPDEYLGAVQFIYYFDRFTPKSP